MGKPIWYTQAKHGQFVKKLTDLKDIHDWLDQNSARYSFGPRA